MLLQTSRSVCMGTQSRICAIKPNTVPLRTFQSETGLEHRTSEPYSSTLLIHLTKRDGGSGFIAFFDQDSRLSLIETHSRMISPCFFVFAGSLSRRAAIAF